MLDEFPSYEECRDTVNNFKKKEKSPELDGLPSDFFSDLLEWNLFHILWSI